MASSKSKKVISLTLLFLLVFPPALIAIPEKAEAQTSFLKSAIAGCAANLVAGWLTSKISFSSLFGGSAGGSSAVPITNKPIEDDTNRMRMIQDCFNGLAYAAAQIILEQMKQSILTWIRGGFRGEPLFISNPQRFFGNIVEREKAALILEAENASIMYARTIARELVRPKQKKTDIGEVLAEECRRKKEAREVASGIGFNNVDFETGDRTARLARAEEKLKEETLAKEKEAGSFFGRINGLFFRGMAAVIGSTENAGEERILLAQEYDFTPGNSTSGDNPDAAAQAETTGGTAETTVKNAAEDCPTTAAEQNARVQSFTNGDFKKGGWGGWDSLSRNPQNSSLGAVLASKSELAARENQKIEEEKLIMSQGWGAVKECPDDDPSATRKDSDGNVVWCDEEVTSPASYVGAAANELTASSLRQAELVKSVNEAVSQVFKAAIMQILNMGLSDLKSRNKGNRFTYRLTSEVGSEIIGGINERFTIDENTRKTLEGIRLTAVRYAVARRESIGWIKSYITGLSESRNIPTYTGSGHSSTAPSGEPNGPKCTNLFYLSDPDIPKISNFAGVAAQYEDEVRALELDIVELEKMEKTLANTDTSSAKEIMDLYQRMSARLPNPSHASSAETERDTIRSKAAAVGSAVTGCKSERSPSENTAPSGQIPG
ncbi:MAG: hypothetical protein AAB355_02335 [Patescibacteria group bacterium]